MRLPLVHHGKTQVDVDHRSDTAYPGCRLINHGPTQAALLPGKLADEPIEVIYASPLTRAQQMTIPPTESLGLGVQVSDGVREISTGVEELNHDWRACMVELHIWSSEGTGSCLEGGETTRQFMSRFTSAVPRMGSVGHGYTAVVSHEVTLWVWVLARNPGFGLKKTPPPNDTQWIVVNGSCRGDWSIEHWSETMT